MKIGILTFHNIPNIGAILQAYALCIAFRKLGVECEIVDYTCDNIKKRELKSPRTGNIFKDIAIRIVYWPKTQRKIFACQDFMRKRNVYSKMYTQSDLIMLNEDYDILVSGSDMIWNLDVTNHDWSYFLDFAAQGKKIVSYGSSVGDVWKTADIKKIGSLLTRYCHLSTREDDTCDFIKSLGLKCQLVADPTLLLTSDEWKSISSPISEKNFVLVYFPKKENLQAAQRYAQRYGKKVVVMNWSRPIKNCINISPLSPSDWLSYFMSADAIFTNSYHGLLFSLYFHKPVWTGNYGNRIVSLLNYLNLKHRMLNVDCDLSTTIDYCEVEKRFISFRDKSLLYIKEILE